MPLNAFISKTLAVSSEPELFDCFRDYVTAFGANVCSYHNIQSRFQKLRFKQGLSFHCFPKPWVDRYAERGYFEIDPIIATCMTVREPFHWYDVGALSPLSPAQRAYLEDLRANGFVDGLAVPIYGAQGATAYFGVGSTERSLPLTHDQVLTVQYACHQVHNRFLELHGDLLGPAPQPLSAREREVLTWLARGKSNGVIAQILGVSEHTVDTLVRRCFAKLGVTDRISAALKGLGLGLVSL